MDDNLPPRLATMDRATPRFRVHRGKHDTKAARAVAAGLGGDTEFAAAQVGMTLRGNEKKKGEKEGGKERSLFSCEGVVVGKKCK